MREMIFAFIHQYAMWGILIVALAALIVLHCMYRQMRKLNRNLGMVTAKVQQYFDFILKEDEEEEVSGRAAVHSEEEPERERRYRPREEDFQLTRGEREMLLSERGGRTDRKRNKNQEEVLDAVLQEYFS